MTIPESSDSEPALTRYERLPVGVIVERRKASNPWEDYIWRAIAIVPGAAPQEPWSVMREEPGANQYFVGTFELELHPRETMLYRENLEGRAPSAYVVLVRDPAAEPHGVVVRDVTLSPGDAEAYMDAVSIVDAVPMPDIVRAWLEDYIAAFHVEQVFHKRQRKPYDPRKGLGGRARPGNDGSSGE